MVTVCRLEVLRGERLSVDRRARRARSRNGKGRELAGWRWSGRLSRSQRAGRLGTNGADISWGNVACAVTARPLSGRHHRALHARGAVRTRAHGTRTRASAGARRHLSDGSRNREVSWRARRAWVMARRGWTIARASWGSWACIMGVKPAWLGPRRDAPVGAYGRRAARTRADSRRRTRARLDRARRETGSRSHPLLRTVKTDAKSLEEISIST